MNYENRIVLFLDILGFQKIIDETTDKEQEIADKTDFLIQSLELMSTLIAGLKKGYSSIITQFSDSIVVSFKEDDLKEISVFFNTVHRLVIEMTKRKLLCRGAIAYGKLYHTDRFIFGPALIEAYLTESKASQYPRIILDKTIIEILKYNYSDRLEHTYKKMRFEDDTNSVLRIDTDDKYFFDYFPTAIQHVYDKDLIEYYGTLKKLIINGYKFKDPSIQIKYGWMKNKFNQLKEDLESIIAEYEVNRLDVNNFIRDFKKIT